MKEKPEKLVACSFPLFLNVLSMNGHLRYLELTPRKIVTKDPFCLSLRAVLGLVTPSVCSVMVWWAVFC